MSINTIYLVRWFPMVELKGRIADEVTDVQWTYLTPLRSE